ncbi:hypothetical protein [Rhizobium laguerreae]|uniref:hypothetical protein n=1 Tax=Rhizobium laguerreae TaxID=1076926 RepID=UPI001C90D99D|nr:hypothetical protein [Rhizobium laguerreae]MBY3347221.1 hypothetical protein [Rhizobium laguerreae]MBY3354183.1 hypothetical protein [Rhizobium laguerreae]MBY3375228.1 hypothetical protein [Rhizobium laguerreae]MBY3430458.1 hypothetical protein [Rhizobium laguerreae]MBY3439106.1 hypothetical protein [Rhizobium laguerreae]
MAKAKPAKKATSGASHRVVGLTLADVSIHFLQQDDEKEPNAEFDYTIDIQTPSVAEDVIFFPCSLKVRKRYPEEEEDIASIGANYFCGVSGALKEDLENEALAKKYAQTTIWSAFSSLFAICTQQMGISFPALPPAPSRIEVANPENEDE